MIAPVIAGIGYFLSIFAFGVAFGTVRELLIEPETGELAAVLIELPFILAACWAASHMLIARAPILRTIPAALTMGLLAFALLMATEAWLALWVPGRTIGDWLAQFREAPPLLGLAGQLLSAFIPLVQLLSTARRAERRRA
jgi:hypothetical protein